MALLGVTFLLQHSSPSLSILERFLVECRRNHSGPITKETESKTNQSKLEIHVHVVEGKSGKTRADESRLLLICLLIG